jgi:SAM-dependent methyltransferase
LDRAEDERHLRLQQYATARNLTARATLHARFSTNPTPWLSWLFPHLRLEQFARVLDVGCGNAALWQEEREVIPAGLVVTLCDLSAGMLCSARKTLAGAKLHLECVQATVQALPFQPNSFDAVLANHMLYHVARPDRALAELQRTIRPGGFVFATTNGPNHVRELDALLHEHRSDIPLIRYAEIFGLESGRHLLGRFFTDVAVHRYPNELEATDPRAVVDYVASLHPERLTVTDLSRIRGQVVAETAARGFFHVTIESGLLVGRRAA